MNKGRPDNITQRRQHDDVAYHTLLSSIQSVRLNGDKTNTTSGANENNLIFPCLLMIKRLFKSIHTENTN